MSYKEKKSKNQITISHAPVFQFMTFVPTSYLIGVHFHSQKCPVLNGELFVHPRGI